jgi:hypothetical protein
MKALSAELLVNKFFRKLPLAFRTPILSRINPLELNKIIELPDQYSLLFFNIFSQKYDHDLGFARVGTLIEKPFRVIN